MAEALDSLLGQTFQDFELIISDNASTDRTEAIGRLYAGKDPRVRYVRNKRNVGVGRNFNAVFQLASGRYFKWAAADDRIHPTFVEKCVEILERDQSVVLAFSRSQLIGPNGENLGSRSEHLHLMQDAPEDRLNYLLANLQLCDAQYGVIRARTLRMTPLFRNFVGADVCLLKELSLRGKFHQFPDYHFFRRFHPNASTSTATPNRAEHYDAGAITGGTLWGWRHLFADLNSSLRAPRSVRSKLSALRLTARTAIWARQALGSELKTAFGQVLRRVVAPTKGERSC
jgi:hypothetical protein